MHCFDALYGLLHAWLSSSVTRCVKTCSSAGGVQHIMEGVACLKVPLTVNVSYGQRWGAMQRM